jgi:hypothetical protein
MARWAQGDKSAGSGRPSMKTTCLHWEFLTFLGCSHVDPILHLHPLTLGSFIPCDNGVPQEEGAGSSPANFYVATSWSYDPLLTSNGSSAKSSCASTPRLENIFFICFQSLRKYQQQVEVIVPLIPHTSCLLLFSMVG